MTMKMLANPQAYTAAFHFLDQLYWRLPPEVQESTASNDLADLVSNMLFLHDGSRAVDATAAEWQEAVDYALNGGQAGSLALDREALASARPDFDLQDMPPPVNHIYEAEIDDGRVLTVGQAYTALYYFADRFRQAWVSDYFRGLLKRMVLLTDGAPLDPAIADDWQAAVAYALNGGKVRVLFGELS